MQISEALTFFREHGLGTLATMRADGTPHLSAVTAAVVGDELWISSTQDRLKTRHVRANPHVSFLALAGIWSAVDGTARIEDGPAVGEMLRTYYRTASGEHPDWVDYDAAMVADHRLIIAVTPDRAYGFRP